MNPDTATNEQLRDWLAERQGYRKFNGAWKRYDAFDDWWHDFVGHPIEDTIDAAHECFPEGWTWQCNDIYWFAFWPINPFGKPGVTITRTTDEATDRFRLAVKAIMAMEEARCQ